MKKMMLLLTILASVHFVGQAQTHSTRGSASVRIQKPEEDSLTIVWATDVHRDSITGTSSLENSNLSLSKEFAEMEFDSWSIYHYMIANESYANEYAQAGPTGRKRVNNRYSKVAHRTDSKNGSPRE
jgi:hypothetical protein